MNQPVPNVNRSDVERIVRRDFATHDFGEVLEILSDFGKETWENPPDRIHLACLKLADGDLVSLRKQIAAAKCDFREPIIYAEYPATIKLGLIPFANLASEDPKAYEKIVRSDWEQYQRWLTATQKPA